MEKLPDIYLLDNLLAYGALENGGYLGKGFSIQCPDNEHADDSVLDQLGDDLRAVLAGLGKHDRLQIRWSCHSNYKKELLRYYQDTCDGNANEWSRRQRNEKFSTFYEQMERRELRREKLLYFVTTQIPKVTLPKRKGRREAYDHVLKAGKNHFDQCEELFDHVFRNLGGSVTPLDDFGHFSEFYEFFNPSAADNPQLDLQALFDPQLSIAESCWNGEASPLERPDYGFWRDGYYHAAVTLKRLPKATFANMMRQLTGLAMKDYRIVVNVRPLDVGQEIEKEEGEHEKLHRTLQHSPRYRMLAAMHKKQRKIDSLMLNQVLPYQAQFVVLVWDRSKEGLLAKLTAIWAAISRMQGAQHYDPAFPTSSWNYFCTAVPGWSWSGYDDFAHYMEDKNVADMIPMGSTSEGHLND